MFKDRENPNGNSFTYTNVKNKFKSKENPTNSKDSRYFDAFIQPIEELKLYSDLGGEVAIDYNSIVYKAYTGINEETGDIDYVEYDSLAKYIETFIENL